MKHSVLVFLGLSILLSLSSTAAGESPNTLRLGILQSTTGIAAEYGNATRQSVELAVAKVNALGKVRIEPVFEDDQTDPKMTVSAYQSLKAKGVDAILGSTWDFTTNAILPLAGRDKMVLLNSTTSIECLHVQEAKGYGFANFATIDDLAKPFASFLDKNAGKSLYVLYANNSWGESQMQAYKKIAAEKHATIIGVQATSSYEDNEWKGFIAKIKSASPDILVLLLNRVDIENILRRASEVKFAPKIFGCPNMFDAFRLSKNSELYNGACLSYPVTQLKTNREFSEEYQKRFGEPPRITADSSFDAVGILADAFLVSKTKDIPLKEALEQMTEYQGVIGQYRFSPTKSLSLGGANFVCIRDKALHVEN